MKTFLTKRIFLSLFMLAGIAQALHAQEYNTGLLLDDAAFQREVETTPAFTNDGRRASELASSVSLRPYCPIPKNQGEISSCTGWALGYGALTISHAYREQNTNRKAITDSAFSALYLYNQAIMGGCMSGAQVQQAARILKDRGNCLSKDFDFPLADCEKKPDEALIDKSKTNAIKDYVALFNNTSDNTEKLSRTKRSLTEGKPVVVGMIIKESLKNLSSGASLWQPGGDEDKPLGGHALVVVGYDNRKGQFDIMNSWGPNWADSGFFQVSYRTFAEYAKQGVQLILPEENLTTEEIAALKAQYRQAGNIKNDAIARQETAAKQKELAADELKKAEDAQAGDKIKAAQALVEQATRQEQAAIAQQKEAEATIGQASDRLVALSGEFVVRMPETDEYGMLLTDSAGQQKYKEIEPKRTGSFYTLEKTDWQEGDQFQVLARNIKKDRYIYLFSFDGNNKLEVHWPRSLRAEMAGEPAAGAKESALVAHTGAEIVIPGGDTMLSRDNLLDDNICALYSFNKIEDIKERLGRLKKLSGPFEDRLQKAFGDLFIPGNLIEYGTQKMDCKTETTGHGSVIPILVKIQNL